MRLTPLAPHRSQAEASPFRRNSSVAELLKSGVALEDFKYEQRRLSKYILARASIKKSKTKTARLFEENEEEAEVSRE